MLLPRGRWLSSYYLNGRCYCHCNVADALLLKYIATLMLADVIAKWQME